MRIPFRDLCNLDDDSLRPLVERADRETVTVALSTASSEVQARFLKQLTPTTAAIVGDDLAIIKPAAEAVEEARQKLVYEALSLHERGEINLVQNDPAIDLGYTDFTMESFRSPELIKAVVEEIDIPTMVTALQLSTNVTKLRVLGNLPEDKAMTLRILLDHVDVVSVQEIVDARKVMLYQVVQLDEQGRLNLPKIHTSIHIDGQPFYFADLTNLPVASFHVLFAALETSVWARAMKGIKDAQRGRIFENLSQNTVTLLKAELDELGPVRMTEVENAQDRILRTLRDLHHEQSMALR